MTGPAITYIKYGNIAPKECEKFKLNLEGTSSEYVDAKQKIRRKIIWNSAHKEMCWNLLQNDLQRKTMLATVLFGNQCKARGAQRCVPNFIYVKSDLYWETIDARAFSTSWIRTHIKITITLHQLTSIRNARHVKSSRKL